MNDEPQQLVATTFRYGIMQYVRATLHSRRVMTGGRLHAYHRIVRIDKSWSASDGSPADTERAGSAIA